MFASHFDITLPTAHKLLEALQSKGYLYFNRDKASGFFIRLVDRAGSAETMVEVALADKINGYGELYAFPQVLGHFALVVTEDIPQASMLARDFIFFDMDNKPQPRDICIAPIGERLSSPTA
jgi:hypothetical protein